MPPDSFDWTAAGKGILELLKEDFAAYVDVTKAEVKAELDSLAREGAEHLQAKLAGDKHADRMLQILKQRARLIAVRHALAGQTAGERVAGKVVERVLGIAAAFLRGFLGMPSLPV